MQHRRPPRFSCSKTAILSIAAATLTIGCGGDADEPLQWGRAQQAIVGGALDESTQGVVGLAIDLGLSRVAGHCSGTLIAPNLVLTAQHCIATTTDETEKGTVECEHTQFGGTLAADSLLISPSAVRPGDTNDESFVHGAEIRTLGNGESVCGQDIALVILEKPIFDIQPITPRVHGPSTYGETFSTVGYGLTDPEDPRSFGSRQRATGSAVRCTGEECVRLSDGAIRPSEWASIDAPICSGDSGGPALDAEGLVFGVASRGDLDCEIAVYGDVASYGAFIVDTALEAAELGEYSAPEWTNAPEEENQRSTSKISSAPEILTTDGCTLAGPPSTKNRWWLEFMILLGAWRLRTTKKRRPRRAATSPSLE